MYMTATQIAVHPNIIYVEFSVLHIISNIHQQQVRTVNIVTRMKQQHTAALGSGKCLGSFLAALIHSLLTGCYFDVVIR